MDSDDQLYQAAVSNRLKATRAALNASAFRVATDLEPGHPDYLAISRFYSPLRISLGMTVDGGDAVDWIPANEGNGFVLVLGSSGSGKTETLKSIGLIVASQLSGHFGAELKANAGTWLVLKPLSDDEAKKNAPNVSLRPKDLTALVGQGDGYLRDRAHPVGRRI